VTDYSEISETGGPGGPASEAALILQVPEAEALVRPLRLAHDPSAAIGVPAHITINYPFLAELDLDSRRGEELKTLFARVPPFDFWLRYVRRFPDVLYLAPDPIQPFLDLIEKIARSFPESPPYGGAYKDIIPHLTVAQSADPGELDAIEKEFLHQSQTFLPIECFADRIWLFNLVGGLWVSRRAFMLGGRKTSASDVSVG
jgi:2'-5' RNA ligase